MLASLIAAALSSASFGQVVGGGDPVFGPGSVTINRANGLAYLDLTHTLGMSRDAVEAQLGPGGAFEGWRIATLQEFADLPNAWGFTPTQVPGETNNGRSETALDGLVALVGITEVNVDFFYSTGTTSDTVGGSAFIGRLINAPVGVQADNVTMYNLLGASLSDPGVGVWLVRPYAAATYQGTLELEGQPADALVDLRMSLYDAGGAGLTNEVDVGPVEVVGGLFTVGLPFGPDDLATPGVTLQLSVREPAGSANPFVFLAPRQPLGAAPHAGSARRAATADSIGGLEIIRGRIAGDADILLGAGFTVTSSSTGTYTIHFEEPFNAPPTVTATAIGQVATAVLGGSGASNTGVTLSLRNSAGTAVNGAFDFIAIGPR